MTTLTLNLAGERARQVLSGFMAAAVVAAAVFLATLVLLMMRWGP